MADGGKGRFNQVGGANTDRDFGYVVLGRNEVGRFRAFDQRVGFPNECMARNRLKQARRRWSEMGKSVFP